MRTVNTAGEKGATEMLWSVYNGDVTPRVGLEQEIAELLNQAFERGFEAGFRSGRAERRG